MSFANSMQQMNMYVLNVSNNIKSSLTGFFSIKYLGAVLPLRKKNNKGISGERWYNDCQLQGTLRLVIIGIYN